MLSYIEISKENIIHNINTLKALVHPKTKIAAVIKGNAYGHDQNTVAKLLEKHVDYFQLDDIEELKLLRKVSKKPTLLFGYVPKKDLKELIHLKGEPCIYDIKRAKILNEFGEEIKVHIKVDAYLGRQGVLPKKAANFAKKLKTLKNLKVKSVYSHFANIEDTSDFTHAQKQIDTFKKVVAKFKKEGFNNIKTHMSATSGVMVYDSEYSDFNIARFGIGIYGLWPSEDLKQRLDKKITLKPVLRWVSHLAQVKTLPANFPIGYGLTYITSKPTKIAIVPQGYSDGYDRGLSNIGEVLVKGKRCKVLGRVAMNMIAVDISHIKDVKAEDEVVLLGKQGREDITAEEVALKLSTINYEIVTRITPLLPRILI